MIDAMGAAASGMRLADMWMARTASNIANAVPNIAAGPGNPIGGAAMVTFPNVDLSVEMPNLLMATDYYKLNIAVMARVQDAYQSIIDLASSPSG
jgi:flagellar basal body rod protein FlgC